MAKPSAESKYRTHLISRGFTPNWREWLGTKQWTDIICPEGHHINPRPHNILNGGGCGECYKINRPSAEYKYHAYLIGRGYTPNWREWPGIMWKTDIICPEGHHINPRPNDIMSGGQGCVECRKAVNTYQAYLIRRGYTPNWQVWCNNKHPTNIICPEGHHINPRPNDIMSGQGCMKCHVIHNVFYVVTRSDDSVKLGITSGDPAPRLAVHASWGYRNVEFLATGLPEGVANTTETTILSDLAQAGYNPVRGREYYGPEAKEFILKLANKYLSKETENA